MWLRSHYVFAAYTDIALPVTPHMIRCRDGSLDGSGKNNLAYRESEINDVDCDDDDRDGNDDCMFGTKLCMAMLLS